MNVKMLLAVASVITVLYGIAFLLVPKAASAQFGITPDAATILADRFLAAALLGLGLVIWFVRVTTDPTALRGLLIGLSVGNAVGVVVAIWGNLRGITNAMGWSTVVIFGVLLAAYLYYLFTDSALAGRK
jgi:hypothetical protein